jgi:hypothetical protein
MTIATQETRPRVSLLSVVLIVGLTHDKRNAEGHEVKGA